MPQLSQGGVTRPAFVDNHGQVQLDRKTSMFMQQLAARKASQLPQPRDKHSKRVSGVVGTSMLRARLAAMERKPDTQEPAFPPHPPTTVRAPATPPQQQQSAEAEQQPSGPAEDTAMADLI